jgi:hypothetical protein
MKLNLIEGLLVVVGCPQGIHKMVTLFQVRMCCHDIERHSG